MLDIKFIRENSDLVRKNCENRNVKVDINKLLTLDEEYREKLTALEEIRQKQNETAKSMKQKLTDDERQKLISKGKELKQKAENIEGETKILNEKRDDILRQIPNLTHPDTPIGPGESANKEIRKFKEPTKFNFEPKDHLELGEKLGIIDFESGAKVAGQKFYYLKGAAALLELALTQYAVSTLYGEGYNPIITPDLARESILSGIGFNPRGDETQIYSIENSELCLIATAEITLGGMLSNMVLEEKNLPQKYVGISHCFRTEAGAAGKESKGLYRVHQFTKIEMFVFTKPEDSEKTHEELVSLEEKLFKGLEIPFRVVDIGSGDLGGPAYRKYDLEAWMPGRNHWGEVTSTSNCTDYQARRLKIRFKREGEKKTEYVHMLNGTAIAISRAIIAIMENNQNEDGSITVPKVLRPYMNGMEVIK